MLCEWQQEEVCVGIAYSTQHVTNEERYQSRKGRGVGSRICRIPIVAEGGTIIPQKAFYNCDTSDPSVAFSCATKPGHTPNFQVCKYNASHSSSTYNKSQKQMEECRIPGRLVYSGSHCYSPSKIWSDHQYCLQEEHRTTWHN